MSALLEYKWFLLVGAEVLFWVGAAAFFVARYWFDMGRLGNFFLGLIIAEEVLTNLFLLVLGGLDYQQAGRITGYQMVTVALIVYAFTLGRHDARRLDAFLKRKVAAWKGTKNLDVSSQSAHPAPQEKAKRYRHEWYEHLVLFVAGQTILLFVGESWLTTLTGETPAEPSGLMTASRVWAVVFAVDTVWSLSYTLWPAGKTAR